MDAEISTYHSLIFRRQNWRSCLARALCTVLLVLRVHIRRIYASGSEVIFSRVVKFANNTRHAKFAKITPPPRNICRIQYLRYLIFSTSFTLLIYSFIY